MTAAGIRLLRNSLRRHHAEIEQQWNFVVLLPSWACPPAEDFLELIGEAELIPVPQRRYADPYAAKLILQDFASGLDSTTQLLYLDYDHVAFAPFNPEVPPGGVVEVGSRTTPLASKHHRGVDNPFIDALSRFGIHNNSLIHGEVSSLASAMTEWTLAYESLDGLIDDRIREESAFTASALRSGATLRSARLEVQSDWLDNTPSPRLFHYGGELPEATTLKAHLTTIAKTGRVPDTCGELLRQTPLGRLLATHLVDAATY